MTDNFYAVTYRYSTNTAQQNHFRTEHKNYLGSLYQRGDIVLSGPLASKSNAGALLICKAKSSEHIEQALNLDPFFDPNLIAEREIRPWTLSYGHI